MTEAAPVVSVIVPVYNDARYLPLALNSIAGQTYRPIEIIIVDDGSTDDSGQVARTWMANLEGIPWHYLYQPNQGPAVARNAGLAAAHGDFVAFLDSDDEWLPMKLEQQLATALRHLDADCILCHMRAVLEPGAAWPKERNQAHYAQEPAAHIPSALLTRRTVFEQIGGFNTDLRVGEDTDWFFRVHDAGLSMIVVPTVLLLRRLRWRSLSQRPRPGNPELLQIVHASLCRRREQTPQL